MSVNKKAAFDMSLQTVVAIVIILLVAALLIFSFSENFGNQNDSIEKQVEQTQECLDNPTSPDCTLFRDRDDSGGG